jgi:hypothetical protein
MWPLAKRIGDFSRRTVSATKVAKTARRDFSRGVLFWVGD